MADGQQAKIFDEFTQPRTWVLLTAALAFLLLGTILDFESLRPAEAPAIPAPWYLSLKTYAALAKEMAFATFIAFIVSIAIERSSRRRQEDEFRAFQQEIAHDVLFGVMKKRFPPAIWREIDETILSANFARMRFHATYTFSNIMRDDQPLEHYIRVSNEIVYVLKNIDDEAHETDIGLSFRLPDEHEMYRHSGLAFLKINDGVIKTTDVVEDKYAKYSSRITLEAGEEVTVALRYDMVKFRSDYEVWTAIHPTAEARIDIISNIDGLTFSAEALQRYPVRPLRADASGRYQYWEFQRPLLPFQGIMIFWREKDDLPPQ